MPTSLSFTPEAVTAHYSQYIEDSSTGVTCACESMNNQDESITAFVEVTSMCEHLNENQIMSILSRRHDWQELLKQDIITFNDEIELDFTIEWDTAYSFDSTGADLVGDLSCYFSHAGMTSRLITVSIPLGEKIWQAILNEDEQIENDVVHACWEALMAAVEHLHEE